MVKVVGLQMVQFANGPNFEWDLNLDKWPPFLKNPLKSGQKIRIMNGLSYYKKSQSTRINHNLSGHLSQLIHLGTQP